MQFKYNADLMKSHYELSKCSDTDYYEIVDEYRQAVNALKEKCVIVEAECCSKIGQIYYLKLA